MAEMDRALKDRIEKAQSTANTQTKVEVLVTLENPGMIEKVTKGIQVRKGNVTKQFIGTNTLVVEIPLEDVTKLESIPGIKIYDGEGNLQRCLDKSKQKVFYHPRIEIKGTSDGGLELDGSNVVIAIIDTGIDMTHPDFDDAIVAVKDFSGDDSNGQDYHAHGSHIAGIIAGRGRKDNAYVGIAPKSRLLVAKAFSNYNNRGRGRIAVMEAIEWAVEQKTDIICLPLGDITTGDASGSCPLCQQVDWAVSQGVVVVAAAGNEGDYGRSTITCPGNAERAITVGAWGYPLSGQGPTIDGRLKPDLVAPGVQIFSVEESGSYIQGSGTSVASAYISGVAALLVQAQKEASVEINPDTIKIALMTGATNLGGFVEVQGAGLVNLPAAIERLQRTGGLRERKIAVRKLMRNEELHEIKPEIAQISISAFYLREGQSYLIGNSIQRSTEYIYLADSSLTGETPFFFTVEGWVIENDFDMIRDSEGNPVKRLTLTDGMEFTLGSTKLRFESIGEEELNFFIQTNPAVGKLVLNKGCEARRSQLLKEENEVRIGRLHRLPNYEEKERTFDFILTEQASSRDHAHIWYDEPWGGFWLENVTKDNTVVLISEKQAFQNKRGEQNKKYLLATPETVFLIGDTEFEFIIQEKTDVVSREASGEEEVDTEKDEAEY